jgi:hypothetical protein
MPEDMPDRMPEDMPDKMPEDMSEDMSDRMPEDLPVTKRINVMVGITRSKVFFWGWRGGCGWEATATERRLCGRASKIGEACCPLR